MIETLSTPSKPFEAQAQLFKILTHPARLAILELLRDGEHCVCHLEAHLGYRQAFISQHLAVMREAGIVQDRREGWNIYYRVADPRLFTILDVIEEITGVRKEPRARAEVNCPCPHCSEAGSGSPLNALQTEINRSTDGS
jgi:ArsR family transcriptional regulator